MKGLKKVALASAIAAVSAGAQAELKALDDATLGETTGQAGITIDLETQWTIGEFMYKDAEQVAGALDGEESEGGSLLITGISLGGNTDENSLTGFGTGNALISNNNDFLDNARLTIDVANGVETLAYGMSEVIGLAAFVAGYQASTGNAPDGGIQAAAAVTLTGGTSNSVDLDTAASGGVIELPRTFGDGDLLIHEGFTDPFAKLNNGADLGGFAANVDSGNLDTATYADLRNAGTRAVDFNFKIDGLGIAGTEYRAGELADPLGWDTVNGTDANDTQGTTTRLLSGIDIQGYLGPIDLHIENNGNGFAAAVEDQGQLAVLGIDAAAGNANSKIHWDRYFRVTDLDIFIDIAGVQLKDVEIHNIRGDLNGLNTTLDVTTGGTIATTSLGFAHSKQTIYAVRNDVIDLEGYGAAGFSAASLAEGFVDGVAINTAFKGDIDVHHLSFGDTDETIGQIFLTDIESYTNWTISAH